MSSACVICRVACCEGMWVSLTCDTWTDEWMATRGEVRGSMVYVAARCKHLVDGRCSIYEDRPQVCRNYARGCDSCRETVARLRPAQAAEILGAL